MNTILKANKNSKKLYIMDARPKINAVANLVGCVVVVVVVVVVVKMEPIALYM